MKKFGVFLVVILFVTTSQAQLSHEPYVANPSRDVTLECMANPVFSQLPDYFNGRTADDLTGFSMADDYSASGNFSAIRIFGGNYFEGPIYPTETYTVEFYDGPPNAGGNLIHTFVKTAVPVPLGLVFNGTDRYYVDIDLGQDITMLSGWINLYRNSTDATYRFSWLTGSSGNAIQYDFNQMTWSEPGEAVLFCLGSPEAVPVSNWAILIGLGLILTFVVIRYRFFS
jgi:hypothetical protein